MARRIQPRQRLYIKYRAEDPGASVSAVMRKAGYAETSLKKMEVRNGLESPRMRKEVEIAMKEQEELGKLSEDRALLAKDPAAYVDEKLTAGARNPYITSNQIRSVELLARIKKVLSDSPVVEIFTGDEKRKLAAMVYDVEALPARKALQSGENG